MPDPDVELFYCSKCKKRKTIAEFHVKIVNGEPTRAKTCLACQRLAREAAQAKAEAKKKENNAPEDADDSSEDGSYDGKDLSVLPLADFLDALVQQDDNLDLTARVDTSSMSGTRKEKADELAARIWNRMKYRFVYHSKYDHRRSPSTRFMYHCAQNKTRQQASKKTAGAKSRDKLPMDAFQCHGWLHITISDWEDIALVKIGHQDDHIPYWSIDVPADVIEFVRLNPKLTPGQV
ncbi:hypothetical protein B0H16DRAFT_1311018, partial [Mycena metata]